MRTLFLCLFSILAAVSGLAAQTNQLCYTYTNGSNASRYWYFNLQVTHAEGITLRSIEPWMNSSVVGSVPTADIYVCNAGQASTGHVSDPSAWTLRTTATHEGNKAQGAEWYYFDAGMIYLPPGMHGIAIHRSGGPDARKGPLGLNTSQGLNFNALASSTQPFGTASLMSWVGCIDYQIGAPGTVGLSATGPGGPLFASMTFVPTPYEQTLIGGTAQLVYAPGTWVTLTAPATMTVGGTLLTFEHWRIDSVAQAPGDTQYSFEANGPLSAVAHYDYPNDIVVGGTCEGTIVHPEVRVTPADVNGQTQLTGTGIFKFGAGTQIDLSIDSVVDGNCLFDYWIVGSTPVTPVGNTLSHLVTSSKLVSGRYREAVCYEPNIGPALGMGDDTLSIGHTLPFAFPLPGGGTTTSIDISTNGFVWLVSGSSSNPSPPVGSASMVNDPPRVAVLWQDLTLPTNHSDVHYQVFSDRAVVTWRNVSYGSSTSVGTAQCQLFANGRVQFTHTGDLSAVSFPVTGVFAGNGGLHPEQVDSGNSWQTSNNPSWYHVLGASELHANVYTSIPNVDGGCDGTLLSGACDLASVERYGEGCPTPATFYTLSDGSALQGKSYRMVPNQAGGYDVSECATSCYETSHGTPLGMGDEELRAINLPFTFVYPSNPAGTTAVDVCSNGFIWMESGVTTATQYNTWTPYLFTSPARIAAFWTDLDPSDPISADVHVRVLPNRVVITWRDVVEYNWWTRHTAQCVLFDDGTVTLSYPGLTTVNDDVIVGWCQGNFGGAVDSINMIDAVPFSSSGHNAGELDLDTTSTPVLGSTMQLTTTNLPVAPTIGVTIVGFAQSSFDLGMLGAPGCMLLSSSEVVSAELWNSDPATSTLAVPANPMFVGVELFAQSAAFAPAANAFKFVLSNGLKLTLGEL